MCIRIESLLSNQEVPILIDFSFPVKEKLAELSPFAATLDRTLTLQKQIGRKIFRPYGKPGKAGGHKSRPYDRPNSAGAYIGAPLPIYNPSKRVTASRKGSGRRRGLRAW